jgi:hypothetical protein
VQFSTSDSTQIVNVTVTQNGNFTTNFKLDSSGTGCVSATVPETQRSWRCDSEALTVTVMMNEPAIYAKYSLCVIIGFVAVSVVGGVVRFLKFRDK